MTTAEPVAVPTVSVPPVMNIAAEYVDRPANEGHANRVAYISGDEMLTYRDLRERVAAVGAMLGGLGVEIEQRVALLLPNVGEFVTTFFGAARIGAVPAPISTAVTPNEQAFLLADSRARVIVTTEALWAPLRDRRAQFPYLRAVLLVDREQGNGAGEFGFHERVAAAGAVEPAPMSSDDVAFWLHTSGSTGTPKWAVHLQRDMLFCEQLYARPVIGLRPGDVLLSGGPCFHAYPLGLTTFFALVVGATVALNAQRPTPARMFELIEQHRVTVFAGVPTLYAQMLAAADEAAGRDLSSLRLCLSAAEPLPAELWRRWQERFGVEILDGIGTTEAGHVFISNRSGRVRPGSSGTVVPGYEVRIVDENDQDVPRGETGNLLIKGGSIFAGYWNRRETTQRVLQGEWYHTGDKYYEDEDGYFWYRGRADDMLRVSGHWVSPAEVEAALITHPSVLEAAVVGKADADELIKPKAFVILREGFQGSDDLAEDLKNYIKRVMAPYNYPRWVEFRTELPKTATGKIQRFRLRE